MPMAASLPERQPQPTECRPAIRFGLPGPLDIPSAVQLVATRLRQTGLPLNVFFFAIILQLLLARFNVIAARARSTFS